MESGETSLLSTCKLENNRFSDSDCEDENSKNDGYFHQNYFRELCNESKNLWLMGTPAIVAAVCQYSLGAITQIFAGHLGTIELAAISVENSLIAGFSFGIMLGMGNALETLCGIAYGAGQVEMLGIYLQRSLIILNTTALPLVSIYLFAAPILKLLGQTDAISDAAGTFALYMIPQLFAYAMNYPLVKFLQSQNKFTPLAVISGVALAFHAFFSWLLLVIFDWGLIGAAVALNLSWWLIILGQVFYILCGPCEQAWTGFSWMAFQSLWGFLKLSLASAFMISLDTWYGFCFTLFAGYLANAEVSVDASSICLNIVGWTMMIGLGLSAAISVRVSNELGAVQPRAASQCVVVMGLTSLLLGAFIAVILLIFGKQYPSLFSTDIEVKKLVRELTPLLGLNIVVQNIQQVLSGVASGAGWQVYVAYINFGCYFLFGVPLCLLLGLKLNTGAEGIWWGLLSGRMLQASILTGIIATTNWSKEASVVEDKVKQWGGTTEC